MTGQLILISLFCVSNYIIFNCSTLYKPVFQFISFAAFILAFFAQG